MNLQNQIKSCINCHLYKFMPDGCHPVPGIGPFNAKIMIIGEALSEEESILEEPFVGKCGKLLDKMLNLAGIEREECFITNLVKCHPYTETQRGKRVTKKNRPPNKNEIINCFNWLYQEVEKVKPVVIFTMGRLPLNSLLNLRTSEKLGDYVGRYFQDRCSTLPDIDPTPIIFPCFHPSYILQHSQKDIDTTVEIFKNAKTLYCQ